MRRTLSAYMLLMVLAAGDVLAQGEHKATATLADESPDPLTPKAVDGPAPLAPGASPLAAVPAAGESLAGLVTRAGRLDETGAQTVAHKDDRAAIAVFYSENGGRAVWTTSAGLSERARAARGELAAAEAFGLDPAAYRIPDAGPFASSDAQADAEIKVALAVLTYARHARGGRIDPTSISRMIDVKPRPIAPLSVLSAVLSTEDPAKALRAFQPQQPGFQNLTKALAQARAANAPAETLRRLEVNLERWRWMPDDLGAFHIRNNVPEQITRVYKGEQAVFTERIVVGKPTSPTPLMSAEMQFVIFHPSWGVPNGIKTNEVGPMLRRASARANNSFLGIDLSGEGGGQASRALARHQLRVFQGGREVNPDAIDWTRADVRNFHFTQPPSGRNVLGVVKFRFPNKYDVYMHDTQEKHLFAQATRAYSHGCMRVQNPMALAEVILAHDKGWSGERVRSHVGSGRTSDVTLGTPIPVHLTYFTATADEAGKLTLHSDIYGIDQRVATALAGKPIVITTAATPSEPAAKAPTRKAPNSSAKQTASVPPASFNPFAGLLGN